MKIKIVKNGRNRNNIEKGRWIRKETKTDDNSAIKRI